MKTREQFIARWRALALVLGMDALAVLKGPPELRQHKADVILGLPKQIDDLIGRMWDDLQEPTNKPPAAAQPATVKR